MPRLVTTEQASWFALKCFGSKLWSDGTISTSFPAKPGEPLRISNGRRGLFVPPADPAVADRYVADRVLEAICEVVFKRRPTLGRRPRELEQLSGLREDEIVRVCALVRCPTYVSCTERSEHLMTLLDECEFNGGHGPVARAAKALKFLGLAQIHWVNERSKKHPRWVGRLEWAADARRLTRDERKALESLGEGLDACA